MTRASPLLVVAVVAGCAHAPVDPPADPDEGVLLGQTHVQREAPDAPVRHGRPAAIRFHMQRHFDDLHIIEQQLLAGDLRDASALAFLLTQRATYPGLAAWSPEATHVIEAAQELTSSPSLAEACRREARVAEACADCHVHTARPKLAEIPLLPPAGSTTDALMARHQWAVDRLWEGVVGVADDRWLVGLDVLAAAPLPVTPQVDTSALAQQLRRLARNSREGLSDQTRHDRAVVYGELLATCAACHAIAR